MRAPSSVREKGATALVVAAAMTMLIGFAAIAIDIGAGFNERRQDQTAADLSSLAGAVGFTLGEPTRTAVQDALDIAADDLDTSYSAAAWQNLWEGCTDPDRTGLTLPDGTSHTFTPLPEPLAWGNSLLDCVSSAASYFRVRIPDQNVNTHFGRIWGINSLQTAAAAVAKIQPITGNSPLVPFGIPGGTANGEICLSGAATGIATDPCDGSTAGAFGEILSELFGDFFGTADCSNPGHPELRQNVALGIDHFIGLWSGDTNGDGGVDVSPGSPHPGDAAVTSYDSIARDACSLSSGSVETQYPGEFFPVNTMLVDTGTSSTSDVEDGLISNGTFLGQPSRLQQAGGKSRRDVVKVRKGANETIFNVDNTGPWEYLTGSGLCDPGSYTSSMSEQEKADRFTQCIATYAGSNPIFSQDIASSPRFVWAPQYWFASSTSGLSWQPVESYRMIYLGGLGFNCNAATGCDQVFYPDSDVSTELCSPVAGGCAKLSLDQLSGWLLPDEAIPESVRRPGPGGGQSPFEVTLIR